MYQLKTQDGTIIAEAQIEPETNMSAIQAIAEQQGWFLEIPTQDDLDLLPNG